MINSTANRSDDDRDKAIDSLFQGLDFGDGPGLGVGVFQSNHRPYCRGFGYADLEYRVPITPRTVFHIASVSKHITAFAVGLLAGDGKLDLDADIRKYLPFVPDFGNTITVRQLIYHTSGLPDQWPMFQLGGQSVQNYLPQQYVINMVSRQKALSFPPGSEFSYSNTGYTLLAEIVRATSGRTLRQFAAERMFQPLGMTHTFFQDDVTEVIPDVSHSYSILEKGGQKRWRRALLNYENVGATGLLTTVEDMIKWAANFSNPVVGDRALLEQMGTSGRLNDGTQTNYGFALMRLCFAGHEALAHNGADAGFRTFFTYFPQSGLSIFIFANHPRDDLHALISAIANIYLNGANGRFQDYAPRAIPASPTLLQDLPGVYINPFEPMVSLQRKGEQLLWRFGTGDPREVTFRSDGTFDIGPGTRTWCYFRPQRDASGRVVALEDIATTICNRFRRLERIEPVAPAASELTELTGDYRSAELDITYSLATEGGQLLARSLWFTQPLVFLPSVAARFDSEYCSIRFARDNQGRTQGFWIHGSRFRNIWFERAPATH